MESRNHLKISTSLEEPCACVFVWSSSNESYVDRSAENADIWLADEAVHYVENPVRMQLFLYFWQQVGVPHKPTIRLASDSKVC